MHGRGFVLRSMTADDFAQIDMTDDERKARLEAEEKARQELKYFRELVGQDRCSHPPTPVEYVLEYPSATFYVCTPGRAQALQLGHLKLTLVNGRQVEEQRQDRYPEIFEPRNR